MNKIGSLMQQLNATTKGLFYLAIFIVLILVVFWIGSTVIKEIRHRLTPKSWTLDIYSSDEPNTDNLKLSIPGYKTQTTCMEKGYSYTKTSGSFECSYGCGSTKDYNGMKDVCEKVCNKFDCRD